MGRGWGLMCMRVCVCICVWCGLDKGMALRSHVFGGLVIQFSCWLRAERFHYLAGWCSLVRRFWDHASWGADFRHPPAEAGTHTGSRLAMLPIVWQRKHSVKISSIDLRTSTYLNDFWIVAMTQECLSPATGSTADAKALPCVNTSVTCEGSASGR